MIYGSFSNLITYEIILMRKESYTIIRGLASLLVIRKWSYFYLHIAEYTNLAAFKKIWPPFTQFTCTIILCISLCTIECACVLLGIRGACISKSMICIDRGNCTKNLMLQMEVL